MLSYPLTGSFFFRILETRNHRRRDRDPDRYRHGDGDADRRTRYGTGGSHILGEILHTARSIRCRHPVYPRIFYRDLF